MKIEELKNVTIAYMRNVGEYGPKNEQLMEDFKNFLKENHLFHDDSTILGIALDNPAAVPPERQRYDVGLMIEEGTKITLDTRKIDDGTYAVFEAPHTKQGVMDFWQNIPQLTKGLSIDYNKPIIERYTGTKIKSHRCEFCIPLL